VEIVVSGRKLLGKCHVKRLPIEVVKCNLENLKWHCPNAIV
jgi:hypothetical protein